MRFIPAIAVAFAALSLPSLVAADENNQQQTVLEYYFGGDEAKYQKAVERLFKNLDENKDGEITLPDLDVLFGNNNDDVSAFEPFGANRLQTVAGVKLTVMNFDSNTDGAIDINEFQSGMQQFQNETVYADIITCANAKFVIEQCQADHADQMKVSQFIVKFFHGLCKTRISSLFKNTVENCILTVQTDCSNVSQCYNRQFRKSILAGVETPSLTRRSLVKRADANTWRLIFWISMIVLAIPAVISVFGIPFYLVALYIANNSMDFDKLAEQSS